MARPLSGARSLVNPSVSAHGHGRDGAMVRLVGGGRAARVRGDRRLGARTGLTRYSASTQNLFRFSPWRRRPRRGSRIRCRQICRTRAWQHSVKTKCGAAPRSRAHHRRLRGTAGFFEEGRVAASSAPIAFVQNSLLMSERISDNFLQSKFAVCMRPVDEVQLWAM